jgi:hypothetical protein
LFGAVMVAAGTTIVVYAWNTLLAAGDLRIGAAGFGPLIAVLGIGILVEAPEIPVQEASKTMKGFIAAGLVAAVAHMFVMGYAEALGLVGP